MKRCHICLRNINDIFKELAPSTKEPSWLKMALGNGITTSSKINDFSNSKKVLIEFFTKAIDQIQSFPNYPQDDYEEIKTTFSLRINYH
ncbi:hypothetical protein MXB_2552 [Myxobolus squamalis]|nr:hypothetical protein MXB_2552 [Myxobolus squamalis]